MPISDTFLAEFDREMATTRKHLERIPARDGDWKPHPKSMPLGALAAHLAEIPSWVEIALTRTELDLNPPGGPAYVSPTFESVPKLLAIFDAHVQRAHAAIAATSDQEFQQTWTLKSAGQAFFTQPRTVVLRSFVLNHLYHHRGQFSVYLRLRDVPVPQSYGPTADES